MNDSKISWLGDIPNHWKISKIKFHYGIKTGKTLQSEPEEDNDILVPYVTSSHVQWEGVQTTDLPEMWATPRQIREISFMDGDLLVCEGGEAGRAAIAKDISFSCIIQNHLHRVRETDDSKLRYLLYYLKAVKASGWFNVITKKVTISNLASQELKDLVFLCPPSDEQDGISSFLTLETRKIDHLIEKKGRLIEILQEKRDVTINNAITKGMTTNSQLRECGIQWPNKIPIDCNLEKLKYCVKPRLTKTKESETDRPYIGLENIEPRTGRLIETDTIEVEGTSNNYESYDVLFGKLRPYLAKAILAKYPGRCTTELLILRCYESILPKFLLYVILSDGFIKLVNSTTYGAKMPRASWGNIREILIPLPSKTEQEKIIKFLDDQIYVIDILISKIKDQIKKMIEYRETLIYKVVTGKINMTKTVSLCQ